MKKITINTYALNTYQYLLDGEVLRQIDGYPAYSITNYGRVFSFKNRKKQRVLKQSISKGRNKGEASISFSGKNTFRVMDLVARQWLKPKGINETYYHDNKVLWDNRAENIKIGSRSKSRKLDYEKGRAEYKGHLEEPGQLTRFINQYLYNGKGPGGSILTLTFKDVSILLGKHAMRAVDRAINEKKKYKGFTWTKTKIKL